MGKMMSTGGGQVDIGIGSRYEIAAAIKRILLLS